MEEKDPEEKLYFQLRNDTVFIKSAKRFLFFPKFPTS